MAKQLIDSGPAPDIRFGENDGDLQVRGWETPQIALQANPDDLVFEQQDDQVTLSCTGNCDLHLPLGSTLSIDTVKGNTSIKFLEERLNIGEVHGNCDVRRIAGCTIGTVHGNFTVKSASDDLNVTMINGNADVRDVKGNLALEYVDGNLDVQNVEGSLQARVDGNARLRLPVVTGEAYDIEADGNIYCYLPEDANVDIRMFSDGVIKIRTPQGSTNYQEPEHRLVVGGGEVPMSLRADGSIYLFIEGPDWSESGPSASGFSNLPDDFGQQVARQVESQIEQQMAEMTRRINEQMEQLSDRLGRAGFSPEETERIVGQAMSTGDRESARAQEKMRRAQEKLERKLEAHRRRTEKSGPNAFDRRTRKQGWGFEWPSPPVPPGPPTPPRPAVSEDERLMILRMLEQKKISLEEAEQLLSALEGNE